MNTKDNYRGCLIGGAAGDALGYAVEFMKLPEIIAKYGENGITEYDLTDGQAIFSDDTQMTLFTGCGLLNANTQGGNVDYVNFVYRAYLDWVRAIYGYGMEPDETDVSYTWLFRVPTMNHNRAPGNTCLTALKSGSMGTIENPINDSCGCGGIMRIAPVGLLFEPGAKFTSEEIDRIGAGIAATTHGHEMGYIPAALLTRIINTIIYGENAPLEDIIKASLDAVCKEFADAKTISELRSLVEKAIELAHSGKKDTDAIAGLGEGWIAQETIAIAVYCAVKYADDFEAGIIAAVNHDGDSDSTGSVAGNILGAYLGAEKIPAKFKENLEGMALILETADDLLRKEGDITDDRWAGKYIFTNYCLIK